jgi:hypothetical protein
MAWDPVQRDVGDVEMDLAGVELHWTRVVLVLEPAWPQHRTSSWFRADLIVQHDPNPWPQRPRSTECRLANKLIGSLKGRWRFRHTAS